MDLREGFIKRGLNRAGGGDHLKNIVKDIKNHFLSKMASTDAEYRTGQNIFDSQTHELEMCHITTKYIMSCH